MNNSQITCRFNEDLKIIKTSLNSTKPTAIILCGGYGRGEGSWFKDDNGYPHPYNDYDLVLVTSQGHPPEMLKSIGDKIAFQIGIRWMNIEQKTPDQLHNLTTTIFNYDLKYASKVIDGDPNILDLIPPIDPSELPLKEAEELFFTRIWTLLGSLDEKGFQVERKNEDSRFFRNQMAKAVLAIVDILLLQKKAYHPSYRERVNRISQLFPEKNSIIELSLWALEEKLQPKAPTMKKEEVQELYEKVQTQFFMEMFPTLTKIYETPIHCAYDLERHLKRQLRNLFRRIKTFLTSLSLFYENRLAVQIAQAYLATAYDSGTIDTPLLMRGIALMRQVRPSVPSEISWDQARVAVAQIRMEV